MQVKRTRQKALEALDETVHLLRSPRNARRLLTALARARNRKIRPQSIDKLRRELGRGERD